MARNNPQFDYSHHSVGEVLGLHGELLVQPQHETADALISWPGIGDVFSMDGFKEGRVPIAVGSTALAGVPEGIHLKTMPIKFPGTDYRIPAELVGLSDYLARVMAVEEKINPRLEEDYAYLTLTNSYVKPGGQMHGGGIHADGLQGPRVQPKQRIDHDYLAVSQDRTRFLAAPVDMTGVSADTHYMDDVFQERCEPGSIIGFEPGSIVLFDSFCPHQAIPPETEGWRRLAKLVYGPRQYDRLGNAVNALFAGDYERHGWEFQARPLPSGLIRSDGSRTL